MSDGSIYPPKYDKEYGAADNVFSFPKDVEIGFIGQAVQEDSVLALVFIDRNNKNVWEFFKLPRENLVPHGAASLPDIASLMTNYGPRRSRASRRGATKDYHAS